MKAKKAFRFTISRKYPDDSIVSIGVGTELEEETDDINGLFDRAKQSTIDDIKRHLSSDKILKSLWKNARKLIKREEKLEQKFNG